MKEVDTLYATEQKFLSCMGFSVNEVVRVAQLRDRQATRTTT